MSTTALPYSGQPRKRGGSWETRCQPGTPVAGGCRTGTVTACRRHRLQPWPGNKSTGTPAPVAGTPRTARLEHDRVHQPADPTAQPSTRWPATTPNWICGMNLAIMDAATEQLQETGLTVRLEPA